jgi:hypothetical protein
VTAFPEPPPVAATVNCELKTADPGACVVTMIAWSALLTVSAPEPLDGSNPASPANEAPTPVGYEPAGTPVRLTPASVATPLEFVWALPTLVPFNVNPTDSLTTCVPLFVSVAERLVVPPNVPVAGSTARVVNVADEESLKQTLTLESDGVTEPLFVDRKASYLTYRIPSNWLRLAPLVVKNVFAVPSGPTKLNGPYWLLLAATWNFTLVPAGCDAVKESVVQCAVLPGFGFASFRDEMKVPEEAKPGLMYVMKLRSRPPTVVSAFHVEPLFVEVTRWPFAYGFVLLNPVVTQLQV